MMQSVPLNATWQTGQARRWSRARDSSSASKHRRNDWLRLGRSVSFHQARWLGLRSRTWWACSWWTQTCYWASWLSTL